MAMWRGDKNSLLPLGYRSDPGWDADLGRRSFRRPSSPLAFLDLDLWNRSLIKDQKSLAWSCTGLSGNQHSKITSTLDSQYKQKRGGNLDMQRWSSASRLAPDGAPRAQCSTDKFELKAALEESSVRRAELVHRLRQAKSHLDAQTDLVKTRDTQLQQSHNISQFLELKQKQLSEAVSVLEQNKEAAEQSRFEESRRRAELQDKVLQLELDILKMRSNLERRTPPTSPNPLSNTLPVTKDEILREGQKQTEKEMKKLREALRRAEETADHLGYEKNDALKRLQSDKENQQEAMNQKLNRSVQTQKELEDRLKESRSRLEQMELERDLLSTKTQRLEDSQNDLKAKLSGALLDKDRLIQEKTELHQKVQSLELQFQREQRGKQSFDEQVCELHTELSQAKNNANRQKKDTIFMKEELLSVKELNEKLSSDLTRATERLQVTLKQLHELEANKLIQTNQFAALETERLKLIGENEELRKNVNDGFQDEIRELKERCCQQRELQENLKQENHNLQLKCQDLEKKVQTMEAEYSLKEEGLQHTGAGFEQEREELRKVAAHWNERWLDVSMTLCSTQAELEEVKKQQQENDEVSSEEVDADLVQIKEELRKVLDMLKIRETELVEKQRELQYACSQVLQQNSEVERLGQLLAERDQKLREKDQYLKHLEIQREQEKADAQIKISALEQELLKDKVLQSEEEVVSHDITHEDFESLRVLLEEYRRTAEELKQERDEAIQQLHETSQQGEAEKPETKKQKPPGLDLVDPNEQRRLVTEQLKSLFREREQCGESLRRLDGHPDVESMRSPVFPRRSSLIENGVQSHKSIKHPLVNPCLKPSPLLSRKQIEDQDLQQRAANESSTKIPSVLHKGPKMSERSEECTQKPSSKNGQMSTLMENLTKRDGNLKVTSPHHIQTIKARLQKLDKGKVRQKNSLLSCRDGTFYARQVEVCDSSDVEESSRGEKMEDTQRVD